MPTPEQWQVYEAQRNKSRYGTPVIGARELTKQPVDPSAEQGNSFIDKARLTLGGIGIDPKAAPLPNETVPGYMGRRIREAYTDTVTPITNMVASAKEPIGQFTGSLTGATETARPAPTLLESVPTPASMPVTPELTSLGNGYGVAGSNTSGRAGYTQKTYYDPSANVVASGLSSATGRDGFVGASTDAQAAKALQDRVEQNVAAQFNIDSMNRAANAERDLRAAQLGLNRGTLDRMEGRNDTAAAMADSAAQSAIPDNWFNPLSMPGDSFQDTRGRQAKYDLAVEQALTGNALEQKGAAATLTALNDLREKNLAAHVAQNKTQAGVDPVDMSRFLLDQQKFNYQQKNDANRYLLDEQKFNYQQGLDKQRLAVDKSTAEGKRAEQQLARQKYMDESRKAFVNEFSFSDPKAPHAQIAGAVFDISQATGVPTDVVSQIYEQAVKGLGIDYSKGGPKDPMKLNKLVAARVAQAYQGQ